MFCLTFYNMYGIICYIFKEKFSKTNNYNTSFDIFRKASIVYYK